MADPSSSPSRALAQGKTIAKLVFAWALGIVAHYSATHGDAASLWVHHAIFRALAGFPAIQEEADRTYWQVLEVIGFAYASILVASTLFAPLGAATRMLARARVRAGNADFLDLARTWTREHPRLTNALLGGPGALWLLWAMWHPSGHWREHLGELPGLIARSAVPTALGAWAAFAIARRGLGALLAPTMDHVEARNRFDIAPDEIVFDAVAVTRRTIGTIALFTLVTLGVPLYVATRPILELFRERSLVYLVVADIVFAIMGALAFRKASHVAVGVDGVHVRGTSRARFFAYRDIDSARVKGGDIELVRRGRAVLRLQLHGEDAARRSAVLARITENLARVKEGRGAVAAQLVASSSKEELARVAHGAADYRMATLTREQLWALVEGPEVEASARKAAAEALVSARDDRERTRLRVAAEHCAEPHVRVALKELAADLGVDDEPSRARAARAQG